MRVVKLSDGTGPSGRSEWQVLNKYKKRDKESNKLRDNRGKQLLRKSIRFMSARREKRFVTVAWRKKKEEEELGRCNSKDLRLKVTL